MHLSGRITDRWLRVVLGNLRPAKVRKQMDCREVERFADISLDQEMEASERAELEAHLSVCPPCRQAFSSRSLYQATVRSKLQSSANWMSGFRGPPDIQAQP